MWHPLLRLLSWFEGMTGMECSCLCNSQFGGSEDTDTNRTPTKPVSAFKIKPDPLLHVFLTELL